MIFMYLYIGAGALLFVAIIVAMIAEIKVKSTYNKYKDVAVQKDITGQMLAEMIAQKEGLNVSVKQCKGVLSDHYNPADKSINISAPNFNQNSIAALGVVAHEMGHAMQDKQGWGLYKVRQFVVKTSNFASKILLPLLIIGIITNLMYVGGIIGLAFIWIAVAFYGLSVLTNLATLPVEFNASKRALTTLQGMEIMDEVELDHAKKVLSAAALTYLASLLVSIAYFLRFVLILFVARDD